MLENIKHLFSDKMQAVGGSGDPIQKRISIATCALLLEMAHADSEFSAVEKTNILKILKEQFQMDEEVAEQLLILAEEERKESLDLWQFTNLINENYSYDEKMAVVDTLWKIIFTDGKVDKHEDYLIRKLTNLLNLEHADMIDSKLRIRDRFRE